MSALQSSLPKLSMIIIARCSSDRTPNAVRLHLLASLHSSTVFSVLCRTPIYNSPPDAHLPCRPLERIRRIFFSAKGRILPDDGFAFRESGLKFESTFLRGFEMDGTPSDSDADSILATIKAVAKHRPLLGIEGSDPEGDESDQPEDYHLAMLFHRDELERFIGKVG